MPAMNRTFTLNTVPKTALTRVPRRSISTTTPLLAAKYGFESQSAGFTAPYEPGRPTEGPLGGASKHGAPKLTPTLLKEHLDKYVVGQDKAKKVTSVAIYNHYQRIRELRRQESEEREKRDKQARWEMRERERNAHPVENEFPGHVETVDLNSQLLDSQDFHSEPELGTSLLHDTSKTTIEKSNLLLLGPSGVGKTYILSTLAKTLEVPFTTIDCSALTQAGYIGTDIESSIERLLLAANHSIQKCETGIIFFDEVDKLAKPAVMTHGRDVSGEGVQQGLLKMIEGTMVTVNAKQDRSSKSENSRNERLERGGRENNTQGGGGKSEQYTIDTTNILFVFAGAFVGLEKIISSRLSSGSSIGFGAKLKSTAPPSIPQNATSSAPKLQVRPPTSILKYVTPPDLQSYGLIPELLGRIPILVSLSPLSLPQLVSILTEPRNSLVKQFTALFHTYGIQLKFTTGALHAIAERALAAPPGSRESTIPTPGGGIGARGLRAILESVLAEVMFHGPGSGIRYCLVDEKFVRGQHAAAAASDLDGDGYGDTDAEADADDGRENMPRCWSRGQARGFEDAFDAEEERWRTRMEGAREVLPERGFEGFRRVGSSGM